MTPRRQRLMAYYLLWMALLTGIYYANPSQRLVWWTGIGLSGAAAVVVGVRLNRPAHALPWYLLALANVSFTAGEVTQVVQTQFLHLDNPFPSVADVFYLAEFVLYAAGALVFIRRRKARQDWAGLLDALILTISLALLAWIYLILPYARNPDIDWFSRAVSIAYPLGDIVVLALLLRLLTPRGGSSRSLQLLTVGTVGILASDTAYGLIQLHGSWHIGTPVDLGWAVLYAAWGAAALHPSMVELTKPLPTQQPGLGFGRLLLLTLAALIAPAILLVESLGGNTTNTGVIGAFSAVLYLLVLARLAVVVAAYRRAAVRERTLREAGSRLTAAVTVDEIAAGVETAASALMADRPGHLAFLAVARTPHARPVGQAAQGATAHGPTGELLALASPDSTLLLPTADLPPTVPGLPHAMPDALLCPLTLAERPSGDPLLGVLVATGTEQELADLRRPLEILATQAALAVERVMLSQEINHRNSELYFRTLVQSASDVILILDDDDTIRYASTSAARVLGHARLDGTPMTDLVRPEDGHAVSGTLARMRGGPGRDAEQDQPREHWRLTRHDRTPIEAEVRFNDLRADPTVEGLVLTLRDVTEQRQMERELTHLAFHDPLTGLANRVLFQDRAAHALERAQRSGTVTGVLFIDLDDFKAVNDTQGHAVGDELLLAVAHRISGALRSSDTAARLGGDEFAVLVENALTPADVDAVADGLLGLFTEPFALSSSAARVTASIGVATTEDSTDTTELLTHADLALYAAKGAGRRQRRHYRAALQARLVRRHELYENLDDALTESAFRLHYQPIIGLQTGNLAGFEALVRWPHDRHGMILPDDFISIAEESGQIVQLGAWVLEQATHEVGKWIAAHPAAPGRPPLRVNVNVSARQFRDAGFVDTVREVLRTAKIAPTALVLELTESVLMRRDNRIRSDMQELTSLGVGIAIDDFGTGYSSLSYLREFPITTLKIDKTFIDGLGNSPQQHALVEGIARIADTLGVTVIAEGIETTVQRDLLAAMGCPLGQGYLFGRPMTAAQARELVESHARAVGRG
ncbi:bifunctional diguanylate cyclase/phosphodiesterase [Streptomyces sp. TLI_171]|uniref:putative bifunctional diguanylate cyclase/phosphodiesterase n=1 Tax=Streptomyces sp. TLI_171 TaxID=1938859 RepID=UPI000C390A1A|nr:EAL domain-containing protein [Streptomyces sp. TLI_171]RKE16888.1 PAS domain S-box-containing protein/diguanylate cyclase (GGDEF)-like protein [Streptomyces sp. TLI_171]